MSPAKSGPGVVRVEGLRELQSALREADRALPRLLRQANKDIAEVVASAARDRAQSLGGSAAKAAASIKSGAGQREAKLSFGGARYPFAAGANFGAAHNRERSTSRGSVLGWNQFPQNVSGADRFMYWAIERKRDRVIDEYEDLGTRLKRLIEGR